MTLVKYIFNYLIIIFTLFFIFFEKNSFAVGTPTATPASCRGHLNFIRDPTSNLDADINGTRAEVADFSQFPLSTLTISMWWRPDTDGTYNRVFFSKWTQNYGGVFLSNDFTKSILMYIGNGANSCYVAAPNDSWTQGQWHHIVATYDGPNKLINMYINGVSQNLSGTCISNPSSIPSSLYDSVDGMQIGGSRSRTSLEFHLTLADHMFG